MQVGKAFSEGARRLWAVIGAAGLTRTQAADRCDLPYPALSRYLNGDRRPDVVTAGKIERAFGIPAALWGDSPQGEFVLPAASTKRTGTYG